MKKLTLEIRSATGEILAEQSGGDRIVMVYGGEYSVGDRICLAADSECFCHVKLDDAMDEAFLFLNGSEYSLEIPFGEKKVSYNPKAFSGDKHLLSVRVALPGEERAYRNLALNPYDCHENRALFPHASANVETRGESVFAARNAIDGNTADSSHGEWPYESWGINMNPNAAITLDFGRLAEVDRVVLVTRADFPHDNWWKEASIYFSDGSRENLAMQKSSKPHEFPIESRRISWLRLERLVKDESDPSPFPALSQLLVYGKYI